jgi:2-polyprenyl-3-methyl-5-hydroxy-6-metoxy-1,4-benzoquinol methylase
MLAAVPSSAGRVPDYEVRLQTVAIAGGSDLEIRSLLDRQQYADPDGEAAIAGISPASWSLFGQVWPSARQLAGLMQAWNFGNRRVLEVGCGLCLASLVVHRRLGDITASDCHPLVEAFLRDNLRRNGLPSMKYVTGNWDRANPDLGKFDLIIGSDVLYERNHPGHLARFIDLHAFPTAEVVVVDPGRSNRRAFAGAMASHGFIATTPQALHSQMDDGSVYRGSVLRFARASAAWT